MKSKLLSYRNTLMLDKYLNHKYSYEDLKNLKKEYILGELVGTIL